MQLQIYSFSLISYLYSVKTSYSIIGLMSGTSMDGLDIAFCFYKQKENNTWQLSVNQTETIPYSEVLLLELKKSTTYSAPQLLELDKKLGRFFAEKVNLFISKYGIGKKNIDAIASHGHTIFHQPEKGYTYQIGCGETIAFLTGIKVINDFRQRDVVAGGQGAPLVPIGDKLLFSHKATCFLNLGGFANCCVIENDKVIAFDISPANLPMNEIVQLLDLEYDKNGEIARSGRINEDALQKLNNLSFYSKNAPKSLGTEWLTAEFSPIVQEIDKVEDKLRTIVEHIAIQIGRSLNDNSSCYVTGGGAKSEFLIERIKYHFNGKIIIPTEQIIDFKEAIIFGFLGVLFLERIPNCLASVTGAKKDVIGGVLHGASEN